MFQVFCLFIGDKLACEMSFVKLDPALPRAEPDPWLALLAAGFHGKYPPGSEEHRTQRRAGRMQEVMQEAHGPGFPLPKSPLVLD